MTNLEIMEINIIREFRNLYVKNMVYIYILRGGVGWKDLFLRVAKLKKFYKINIINFFMVKFLK